MLTSSFTAKSSIIHISLASNDLTVHAPLRKSGQELILQYTCITYDFDCQRVPVRKNDSKPDSFARIRAGDEQEIRVFFTGCLFANLKQVSQIGGCRSRIHAWSALKTLVEPYHLGEE